MNMKWSRLLSPERTRELSGGAPSEKSKADKRSQFERDYDRAIFSTAVRRLQDKAQVFPLEPNDYVRTRLTHSLEVSTVARGIAGAATRWMLARGHLSDAQAEAVKTIASTCGLLHDLGNPPFGHSGEEAIQGWCRKKLSDWDDLRIALGGPESQLCCDLLKFDGNAQTIRIVSNLQMLADRHGLNLTCATFSALCKYTARSDKADKEGERHEWEKPGYFASEERLVSSVRDYTGTGDARNPIAFLVEASDDIVYSVVDIEDGIKKGVVDWDFLVEELPKQATPDKRLAKQLLRKADEYVRLGGLQLTGKSADEARAQLFRTYFIEQAVAAAVKAFRNKYAAIMNGEFRGELVKVSERSGLVRACKLFGRKYVYVSDETVRLELMGREVITDLLDIFWEGARHAPERFADGFGKKVYSLFSRNYRKVFEDCAGTDALPLEYRRLQLAIDYVSGMTDTYACTLHRQLFNG